MINTAVAAAAGTVSSRYKASYRAHPVLYRRLSGPPVRMLTRISLDPVENLRTSAATRVTPPLIAASAVSARAVSLQYKLTGFPW